MSSFCAEVKTHFSLLGYISDSMKDKLSEVLLNTKRLKCGILNGTGTLFKVIFVTNGEYFTDIINKLNKGQPQIEILLKSQMSVTLKDI